MSNHSYIEKLRGAVGHEKLIIPAVMGILQDSLGRVLLQERVDFDVWALPGGFLEVGESALEALRREIAEETGLRPLSGTLVGLYTEPRFDVTYPNGDKLQTFAVVFHVAEWTGELDRSNEESKDLAFFDPAHLPERVHRWAREILQDFLGWRGRVTVK